MFTGILMCDLSSSSEWWNQQFRTLAATDEQGLLFRNLSELALIHIQIVQSSPGLKSSLQWQHGLGPQYSGAAKYREIVDSLWLITIRGLSDDLLVPAVWNLPDGDNQFHV